MRRGQREWYKAESIRSLREARDWADGVTYWMKRVPALALFLLFVVAATIAEHQIFGDGGGLAWHVYFLLMPIWLSPLVIAWRQGRSLMYIFMFFALATTPVFYAKNRWREDLKTRPAYCRGEDAINCLSCGFPSANLISDPYRMCCFCCDVACTPLWEQQKRINKILEEPDRGSA